MSRPVETGPVAPVEKWPTWRGVGFVRSAMYPLLRRVNAYLRRWAGRKYKRLRTNKRYSQWLAGLLARQPALFTHWRVVRTS